MRGVLGWERRRNVTAEGTLNFGGISTTESHLIHLANKCCEEKSPPLKDDRHPERSEGSLAILQVSHCVRNDGAV